ncbi:UDP-glycosyltransferase [Flavobacterium sp.]|uniref:UDP-glycosyltransferase n=1 Tax=Flavobacterium sp. TaxID=239 RepID=UPI002B4B7BEE|nr:UDP-glycosyltransferase [Flavobacterium sp.]HLF51228.1 hypothetical protein [Flavobacterium sp.]
MKNISKILIVVDSINVNDSSGSKANVALITNLNQAGFQLKVYHYTQKEIHLADMKCISILEKKGNGIYLLSRLQRLFSRWTGINLNPFLEGFFGFSFTFFNDTYSVVKAVRKEVNFEPDLVITLSKGSSFRPHYALLKFPQWHSKWMAYIHDPYPFHYYPRPYNWIQPGYKQKENFFLAVSNKAKYSAFPSLLLKEWMGSYFPDFLKTGVVIPHQLMEYALSDSKLPAYFKEGAFTILHAGTLMKQRNPKFLLDAYQSFLKRNPEAIKDTQLLLIGRGNYHKATIKQYESRISGLTFINQNVPFKEVLGLQNQASVNVILESKSEISPFLPAKFPHCVIANKAILLLGPYYSESKRLLGNDYPYWAEADDSIGIEKLITDMYLLWKEKRSRLELNRDDLKDYLSMGQLKKSIEKL